MPFHASNRQASEAEVTEARLRATTRYELLRHAPRGGAPAEASRQLEAHGKPGAHEDELRRLVTILALDARDPSDYPQ